MSFVAAHPAADIAPIFAVAVIRKEKDDFMKYKTLLFDADMTLFDFKKAEELALVQTLKEHKHPADEMVVQRYSVINDELWKVLELGQIKRENLVEERFRRLFEELGIYDDPSQFNKEYMNTLAELPILCDGAEELCKELHGNYRMYIITNGSAVVQHRRFRKSALLPYFEGYFISEETGSQKPQRAYFDYVRANIPNWEAETTLVIGDSLSSDIQGAINYGLDSCWINWKGTDYTLAQPCTYEVNSLKQLSKLLHTI